MSEQVDFSLSTGSDSDFDMSRRMKVRLDSKDIGYGSESHSNDEAEYKKFHQSLGLVAGKRDGKLDIYRMTVVESTDRTDGEEAEVSLADVNSSKDSSHEKSESQNVPSELDYDSSPKEDIKFLIDQVDNVYRESSPFRSLEDKRRKDTQGENASTTTEIVKPTMVDASVGTTTVVESSCDASGEDSDSAEEFSTATDDGADTLFDSVICLDYTSDSKNASQENICLSSRYPPFFDTSKLRKNKRHGRTKERPWSVVELQDVNNKQFDLQIFSTSESAIDRLAVNHSDSESPPKSQPFSCKQQSSTFPRQRTKHHSFQRTFSASEQSSSSPIRSKRKLRYTNSSHTDTASGSQHTVPSTSDDDTNVPGSETENLLARLQKAKMKTSSSSYDTDSGSSRKSTVLICIYLEKSRLCQYGRATFNWISLHLCLHISSRIRRVFGTAKFCRGGWGSSYGRSLKLNQTFGLN